MALSRFSAELAFKTPNTSVCVEMTDPNLVFSLVAPDGAASRVMGGGPTGAWSAKPSDRPEITY